MVYGLKRGSAGERRAIDKGLPGKHDRARGCRSMVIPLPQKTADTRKANETDEKHTHPRAKALAREVVDGLAEKKHVR